MLVNVFVESNSLDTILLYDNHCGDNSLEQDIMMMMHLSLNDISLWRQRYIEWICHTLYKISLRRYCTRAIYRQDMVEKLWYTCIIKLSLQRIAFMWDISLRYWQYISDILQEGSAIFNNYCLHYFFTIL